MKKTLLYFTISALALGCTKEKEIDSLKNTVEEQTTTKYVPILKKMGFSTKSIKDMGNSIIVEEDIRLSKDYLDSISKSSSFNLKQAMWSTAYLTRAAVSSITVYTNGTLSSDWVTALQAAATNWTNLTGSVITINYSASSGNILVRSDGGSLGPTTIAAAGFPTNPSTPYSVIDVNIDYGNLTYAEKVYTLVHELGHCIGFRHTNWVALGEPQVTGGGAAWEINHGCPTSDANSVMNGGALKSWNGFSTYDVLASELIYPQWGDYVQLGSAVWPNTYRMTTLNGYAYVVQYDKLYRINMSNGSYTQIGAAVWTGTEGICALNGYIYLVQNSRVYRVDPSIGSYTQIGPAVWPGTEGMCALNGYIYLVENSRLYRVDPSSGSYTQLGGAVWTGTYGMCSLSGYIYILENSRLYKVDPSNGSYTQLGGAVWAGAYAITANSSNNMLYITQNDLYYKVSPANGTYTRLGGIAWANTNSMTSNGSYNYIIENSRFYRIGIN